MHVSEGKIDSTQTLPIPTHRSPDLQLSTHFDLGQNVLHQGRSDSTSAEALRWPDAEDGRMVNLHVSVTGMAVMLANMRFFGH